MPRTLSIGGATYDLFVATPGVPVEDGKMLLPLGGKIRTGQVIETIGGGAANTSVGLSRLGCDAAFCGVIGSDQWGERICEALKKEKVNTDAVTIVEGETTSFSIILSAGGERVILYEPGTNAHLHDATFDRAAVRNVDWVYLNHLTEEACEITDDLVDALKVEDGPGLTWNPGGCQIGQGMHHEGNRELLIHTDLILLNKEEALAFTKTGDIENALAALIKGGAGTACITDGSRGATATDGRETAHCPIMNTPVVDSTGAGDAFGTAMTWAILSGLPLRKTLQAGTINAASVISVIGAQPGLLTHTSLRKQIESL
jgi:ribokinase